MEEIDFNKLIEICLAVVIIVLYILGLFLLYWLANIQNNSMQCVVSHGN